MESTTMSETTTATLTPSTPNDAVARAALESVPLYADATPEQRAALEQDMARCLAEGIGPDEYLEGLATWGGDAADYLAECGDESPADADDSTAAEQDAPVPTSTLAEANKTLKSFGEACRSQADANYR